MPSIASIFRPKIIRRVLLTMLLAAPIVYLFGTQIATLAGAHGESVLQVGYEIPTSFERVDFNQKVNPSSGSFGGISLSAQGTTYTVSGTASRQSFISLSGRGSFGLQAQHVYIFRNLTASTGNYFCYLSSPYVVFNNEYTLYTATDTYSSVNYALTVSSGYSFASPIEFVCNVFDLTQMYGFGNEPTINEFLADWGTEAYSYTLSEEKTLIREGTPNNSESLFNQFFPKYNFLAQWGTSVLEDRAVGFEPVNALMQYVGGDMLHLQDTQIGLMALGYSTYVFNVLIVYMLVSLCASLICLPLKVMDIFNRGENL